MRGEGGKGNGEREGGMDGQTDGWTDVGRKSVDCASNELTRQVLTPEKLIEI